MAFPERLKRQDGSAALASFTDIAKRMADCAARNEALGMTRDRLGLDADFGSRGSSLEVTASKANETSLITSQQGEWMAPCQPLSIFVSTALCRTAMPPASAAP